jgi:uncharacterized protein YndB with AHSA1/START domain
MTEPSASATIAIAAPPSAVYELISDVPALPTWATETTRVRWLGKATGPAVGARFLGINRNGLFRWFSVCEVVAAVPGEVFSWEVLGNIARWEYRIEETAEGCTVTESTWDLRGWFMTRVVGPALTGVADRRAHNQTSIQNTLARLKTTAEAQCLTR